MRRWAGIAGIVFVVLGVVSVLVGPNVPSTETADATERFAEFWAGDGNEPGRSLVSAITGGIALFAFLWFIGGLWSTLRSAAAATTTPTMVVAMGGAAYFALDSLAVLTGNIIGVVVNFSEGYEVDPGLALVLADLATGMFMLAMMAAGAAALAAGLIIRRTGVLPGWLLWLGAAIAVLSLPLIPPVSFLAALLFLVWVAVISVVMIQRNEPEPV